MAVSGWADCEGWLLTVLLAGHCSLVLLLEECVFWKVFQFIIVHSSWFHSWFPFIRCCQHDQNGLPAFVLREAGHAAEAAHPLYGRGPLYVSRFLMSIPNSWVPACVDLILSKSSPAFSTRLFSVLRFESVIHEFDPWVLPLFSFHTLWLDAFTKASLSFFYYSPMCRYFNYRTTRFLAEEGFYKFHNWFDDRAWYPLGRIIGGTIYPGGQF